MEAFKGKRIGKYEIYRTLGKGGSCKVKLGRDTTTGQKVAVKIMNDDMDAEDLKLVVNEVEAIRGVAHPNVISVIECGEGQYEKPQGKSKTVNFIIVEIAAGGELFDFISDTGRFPEPLARFYFRQFMDGLKNVHDKGLAHRDLKPENVLLDGNYVLKIADFGFAAPMEGKDGQGFLTTRLGTKNHMAPEIHLKKPYKGNLVDLFASAIILFTMVSQHPPFNSAQPSDPYYKCIGGGKFDTFWNAHSKNKPGKQNFYSTEFKDMVTQMLMLDPEKRLTMEQVQSHAWYTKGEVPSHGDVRQEFAERQKVLQENLEAERHAKEAEKQKRTQNIFVARGGGGGQDPTEEEIKEAVANAVPKKELQPYEPIFKQGTQFKTTCNPDVLEESLKKYLDEQGVKTKINANKYKIKFEQEWTGQDNDKNTIGVTVCILKDPEAEKSYYVEFTKTAGPSYPFTQIYTDLKDKALHFAYEDAAHHDEVK